MNTSPTSPVEGTALTHAGVTNALRSVSYPGLSRDLVSFGMVQHVSVCDGRVKVVLGLRTTDASIPARIEKAMWDVLEPLGAVSLAIEIRDPAPVAATAPGARDPWGDQARLATVQHVIAVGAGKGGVGKSTVAVNLALALAKEGLRTGLLDADIYGPSLPILLGIEDGARQVRMSSEKHIMPLEAHGLPLVSFGFFLGEGSPAIWRGPMVSKAVKQFARGVAWPELDILVVDLPPGTGDVPLSLAQSVALSGAVVVTQPARVAIAEARKAAEMFRSLEVPLLGIVENMSGPFGRGAGLTIAAELETVLLGEIPFDESIVAEGDRGVPSMVGRPGSDTALAFDHVATGVASALGWQRVPAAVQ
ncbi:MAG: Mrp/NBP35 family ATP-binding protein [Gemmatimonadaceae bacterium]|nr:Mrp/NBP35 family ATP-binding protein [Gemmatimonadaceae bacterium]